MTATSGPRQSLAQAVLYSSVGSLIVPLVGLAVAPILANGLGVVGRGELAAALAPSILVLSIATLGLPEAVTFVTARRAGDAAKVLRRASLLTGVLGLVFVGIVAALTPVLTGGRDELVVPMLIADVLAIPSMLINVVRGVAAGLQRWALGVVERLIGGVARLGVLIVVFATGHLDVLTAVILISTSPVVGALAYLGLRKHVVGEPTDEPGSALTRRLLSYGLRAWSGSIAGILLGRLDQTLFASVSTVEQLGIYAVAVTISDITYLVLNAIGAGLFGVTSKTEEVHTVAQASRVTLLAITAVSVMIGITLPFWIEPLFGTGFGAAVVPTWILLLGALVQIPGQIGGTGVSASGRPGARSVSVGVAVAVNVAVFFLLVPAWGAVGAAWSMVAANIAMSTVVMLQSRRLIGVAPWSLVLVRREDLAFVAAKALSVPAALRSRRG